MNPISNERQVSLLGNTGDVAGLVPVTQPRSETRLDAATVQVAGQARKSGVSLNAPLAVSNSQVSAQQLGEIGKLVASVKENTRLILPYTTGLVTAAFTSPEAFEIELGKLTSDLEKTQTKLKLDDIRQARTLNEKKIGENQAKIKEAEESAQEAKKAGIFGKIFGWLSAIASLVTIYDLMGVTKMVFSRSFDFQVYLWAAVLYLVIVEIVRRSLKFIEGRLGRHLQ